MSVWLLNRLKEKSTWLAIFTMAGLFGMKIEPELREYIINAILAVAAVAAFIFQEKPHEPKTVNVVLPPIDLVSAHLAAKETQARRVTDRADPVADCCSSAERLRESVSSDCGPESNGWNG